MTQSFWAVPQVHLSIFGNFLWHFALERLHVENLGCERRNGNPNTRMAYRCNLLLASKKKNSSSFFISNRVQVSGDGNSCISVVVDKCLKFWDLRMQECSISIPVSNYAEMKYVSLRENTKNYSYIQNNEKQKMFPFVRTNTYNFSLIQKKVYPRRYTCCRCSSWWSCDILVEFFPIVSKTKKFFVGI